MSNSSTRNEFSEGAKYSKKYWLQLFVTGATPNSARAIANVKALCEKHLKDSYQLDVIDVYKEKDQAKANQIVALPMLIKRHPSPERKLIGDMSKTEKVLEALGIE